MLNSSVYTFANDDYTKDSVLINTLNKAKKGDSKAFAEIYNWYFKKIYRFVYFRVSHKETAEDLTEDVFIKAYGKINSLSEVNSFEGWLYKIARNLIIDYYRQKQSTVDLQEIENTIVYEQNLINLLVLEEHQKTLLRFLKKLPEEQQMVIRLRFFEDLEIAEISEILNKSQGAIRVMQHRAITKLKELISTLNG